MTIHYCDRCGKRTAKDKLASLDVIENPDWSGDHVEGGSVTRCWVLCRSCVKKLRRFIDYVIA